VSSGTLAAGRAAGQRRASTNPVAVRLRGAPMWTLHVAFAVLFFGTWEYFGRRGGGIVLPRFSDVASGFWGLTVSGELPIALGNSLLLLVLGFGSAVVVGFLMGVAVGRFRLVDRSLRPFLDALYTTPIVALVPLILVWFGFGLQGRVIIVFLASFFPILINVYAGVKDAPKPLLDVAQAFGVRTEVGLLTKVIIPAATPFIVAGLRLGIGRGVIGMAVAEVYLRLGGIGSLIVGYGAIFRTDLLIASILPLPILGVLLSKGLGRAEQRFQNWKAA
jgi:ABC-type nitrate/sulfonate/bicarbonate transport system permease component